MQTDIRELKKNLSRWISRIEAGERISITAQGRVVAELVPPRDTGTSPGSRWDELIAAGILRLPVERGCPFEDWPAIRLSLGTAAELINSDRGEA
jgi:antitoxin (DNA-binding transcriptional repressor) of toxin-antitoxin stability system